MARKPMITRTMKATKATALCVDTNTESIVTREITVSRTYKDEKSLVKAIEKANLIPEGIKLVSIKNTEVVTKKYGMTEDEFMAKAQPLD